jgi:ABC-type microcin C transport system permease subunit YejE
MWCYLLLNGSDCINFVKLLHLRSICSRDRNYYEILIYSIDTFDGPTNPMDIENHVIQQPINQKHFFVYGLQNYAVPNNLSSTRAINSSPGTKNYLTINRISNEVNERYS